MARVYITIVVETGLVLALGFALMHAREQGRRLLVWWQSDMDSQRTATEAAVRHAKAKRHIVRVSGPRKRRPVRVAGRRGGGRSWAAA